MSNETWDVFFSGALWDLDGWIAQWTDTWTDGWMDSVGVGGYMLRFPPFGLHLRVCVYAVGSVYTA